MIAALLLAATLAGAESVIVNPRWETLPSPDLLDEPMPPFAMMIDLEGRVVLECRTLPRVSAPQGCVVVSSSVTGLGFEAKAIETAATGLLAPRTINGVPTPSSVRFSVRFSAEDWKAVAPRRYLGPTPSDERLRLARQFVERYGPPFEAKPYADIYPELEPVRRARVQAWVAELFPLDPTREREQAAIFLARLVTEADLKTGLETGRFLRPAPSEAEMEKASSDFGDLSLEAAAQQLRARYCADYHCDQDGD